MSVYKDMANDAGYPYGGDENEQMAQAIEQDHMRQMQEWDYEQQCEEERERLERVKEPCKHCQDPPSHWEYYKYCLYCGRELGR